MAVALESFVKQLADSGIIAPGKLENFVPPKASPKNVQEPVTELIKQKQLTKFQAQEIHAGRGKSLILGNYTLLDKIGEGGMGQVFKAEHRRMKRVVALKMLPPSVTKDPMAVARFQREVEAAARLSHPNIVAAHDADEAGGVHFLIMEYVEGSDLSALVKKNGPFSVELAVNYILQAARGLEFAHGEGVIHRDIKPANLLLDKRGTVKILDMGLARVSATGDAATQAELTGSGAVMGTVDYMATEQAMSTRHANARADVYSLGCSLYYLLSGRAVYEGETLLARMLAHREQPIPAFSDFRDDVPDQIEAVFRKMVAKTVEDRYQTMSEVITALQTALPTSRAGDGPAVKGQDPSSSLSNLSFLKELPTKITQRSTTRPSRAPAGGGFQNKKLAIIGAGVLGSVALAVGLLIIGRGFHDPAQTPTEAHPTAESGNPSRTPPPAVAPFDAKQAPSHQEAWAAHLGTKVETTNSIGMKLVLIPPGEFLMGSTDEQVEAALKVAEKNRVSDTPSNRIRESERPQHKVSITVPFWMGFTEVTIGQYQMFVAATGYVTLAEKLGAGDSSSTTEETDPKKKNAFTWRAPGYKVKDESPVTQVTWNDACAFCAWLSEQEGRRPWYRTDGKGDWLIAAQADGYRLPTEAQWEYACRAGTTTQYSFGDDYQQLIEYGWYDKNAGDHAWYVGLKRLNPFSLYDMHGNVYEWCQDFHDGRWYEQSPPDDPIGPSSGLYRVTRGGSWHSWPSSGRSAYRDTSMPSDRDSRTGFRVVRAW